MGLLDPLYAVVAWVLVTIHSGLSTFIDPASGAAWALSIVVLVIIVRILLIPLFVKQIKAQRAMSALQPEMKKLQDKYKGDKERLTQEMQKLWKENGTNPLAGCLPILLQSPFFFALFHILNYVVARDNPNFALTPELVEQAQNATIFGAPIAATFLMSSADVLAFGGSPTATKIVCVLFIIIMTVTMFITQRQLMIKNMPTAGNPMAQQQKILLYVFPLVFLFSGVNFPIGVLIYWMTTNLWTMGQQFWVIRNNPAPGTPAFETRERRLAAKAAKRARGTARPDAATAAGSDGAVADSSTSPSVPPPPARVQPKRQTRSKRSRPSGTNRPAGQRPGKKPTPS
jgi:YidC/Oxa1 family membrane protein insertase